MSLHLVLPTRHPDAPMVLHLVREYATWWRLDLNVSYREDLLQWKLDSVGTGSPLVVPIRSADRVPLACANRIVHVGGTPLPLPCPDIQGPVPPGCTFAFDIFNFLAGQLWRAEEQLPRLLPQAEKAISTGFLGDRFNFFDRPVVDLWMRSLFEHCLGGALLEPAPTYWLTFDVDCLQKWKTRSRIRHWAGLPKALLNGGMVPWHRNLLEIQRSRRPQDDPWYQIPQILERTGDRRATFFWLGTPRDHQAYRYDIQRLEFATLLQETLKRGHTAGMHGSPRHARSLTDLGREAARLQSLSGHPVNVSRQHYLRIDPKTTLHALSALGFRLDSSLGFNDRPGFRCGSCIPIRWWDFQRHESLPMAELPFSAGDFNLHNPSRFDTEHSRATLRTQAGWAMLAGGILTLLFHEIYFWEGDFPGHANFFSGVLSDLEGLGLRSTLP